jgi:endogenous inhibitor of DNA gyrase (YacG/DUF329 family)
MPRKRAPNLRCPICKKEVSVTDSNAPFCSDRCRTIDLGKWASGGYLISSPVADAEDPIREDAPDNSDKDR